jgi:hypothetical protein
LEKSCLECGQQRGVHRSHIGYINLRRKVADVQAIQKPAQVAYLVRRQGFLDFGKPGVCETRKGQISGCTHRSNTDEKREDLGDREPRCGLNRLRIKLQAAPATRFRMMTKPSSRSAQMSRNTVRLDAPTSSAKSATVEVPLRRRLRTMASCRRRTFIL